MNWNKSRAALLGMLLAVVAAINGCGGGTDGTGIQVAYVQGVMTKGSIIVNGIHFDDSSALIEIDSGMATPADLESGMFVMLRGTINPDGLSGVAERVQVINEVRGLITALDQANGTLVVVGQQVSVDASTRYSHVAGIANLGVGQRVEVFGLRDAEGGVRASLIVLLEDEVPDDLRGTVSALTASTFTLNGVLVDYSGATVMPLAAVLANGQLVEVDGGFDVGSGVFTASRVVIGESGDGEYQPRDGEYLELEGYVAGLDSAQQRFSVNGRAVRYSSATTFEGGTAATLADNVEVSVKGVIDGDGVLDAAKIEIEGRD